MKRNVMSVIIFTSAICMKSATALRIVNEWKNDDDMKVNEWKNEYDMTETNFYRRAEQFAMNYVSSHLTSKHKAAEPASISKDQLVFGKPSWATASCKDIAYAHWVEPVEPEGHWFVKTLDTPYACGDCSSQCTSFADYSNNGIENCGTKHLSSNLRVDCDAFSRSKGESPQTINMAAFGDSHTRVLFFHIWRLLSGSNWPEDLPAWMKSKEYGGGRSPTAFQTHQFSLCEDRLIINVEFHYKRYYKTAANEAHFLETLRNRSIAGKLDLLIVGESIWSTYEQTFVPRKPNEEGFNMTLQSEQEYFLNWVAHNFASEDTYTILSVGSGESPEAKSEETNQFIRTLHSVAAENPTWSGCVLDRRSLARPPAGMICHHGCDGPVPMIYAQAILRSLFRMAEEKPHKGEYTVQ